VLRHHLAPACNRQSHSLLRRRDLVHPLRRDRARPLRHDLALPLRMLLPPPQRQHPQ
jgi:hypothetical protein